jgi:hypothetical protein
LDFVPDGRIILNWIIERGRRLGLPGLGKGQEAGGCSKVFVFIK